MKHQKPRRGIVLLIVLSLLTLFALLMVTFLVVSGQYQNTALATSRIGQTGDHPKKLLDSAMYQLVRGSRDPHNPIRGHSFLNDMYGHEGFRGPLARDVTGLAGVRNQFHQYRLLVDTTNPVDLNGSKTTLSPTSGYYNGCVLTVISGEGRGLSTRIVAYDASTATFSVLPLRSDLAQTTAPVRGDNVLINGHPFNGTGFGYLTGLPAAGGHPYSGIGQLDHLDPGPDGAWGRAGIDDDGAGGTDDPAEAMAKYSDDGWSALFPNRSSRTNMAANQTMFLNYMNGGADESCDAVDYQNMSLAMVPDVASGSGGIIPSFHRPALINFWFNYIEENWLIPANVPDSPPPKNESALRWEIFLQPYGPDNIRNTGDEYAFQTPSDAYLLDQIVRLKERIIFRPLPERNPQFTGSNPDYALLAGYDSAINPYIIGAWDIDNDGDGIKDSIWIDPDFPIQTAPDGRLMKPLFAFLCVDLDGRINVNAHGRPAPPTALVAVVDPTDLARNGNAARLPRGSGYGPPEVDLNGLFSSTEISQLLYGDNTTGIGGRYGSRADRAPGIGNASALPNAASFDLFAQQKFYQYPSNFFNAGFHAGFETPPDLLGELQVGLDHRGQPQYTKQNTTRHLVADSPYELDLSSDAPRGPLSPNVTDYPFTLAELERVLRAHDFDSGLLPRRLERLGSSTGSSTLGTDAGRRSVTTDSFDLPVPQIHYPIDMVADYLTPGLTTAEREVYRRPGHILDILRARVFTKIKGIGAGNLYLNNIASFEARLSPHYTNLLAPGLLTGTRMDVNHPLGNGLDDNNNQVIDEHWQNAPWAANESSASAAAMERVWGVPFDHDNDGLTGSSDTDAFLARQHLARRLYMLMMILKHPDYEIDENGDGSTSAAETAHAIAQWAINVVDFRDSDSIMTPFEYDPTPLVPHPGKDGVWGSMGDDDMNGMTDDALEMFYPGSDDTLWRPDGWLGDLPGQANSADDADPRVQLVWGCERPEVLISETIAFHDRRSEDLATPNELTTREDAAGNLVGETDFEAGTGANDFDQRFKPLGSMYIELFNAWTSEDERKPAELCRNSARNAPVLLGKRSAGVSPVWRLMVADTTTDPDAPGATVMPERVIYFANGGVTPPGARTYISAVTPAPLFPGRYAVIGTSRARDNVGDPAGTTSSGSEYVNQIGVRGDADAATSRKFTFHVDSTGNADHNWFYLLNNNDTLPERLLYAPNTNAAVVDFQPPVAVPVTGLEISEGDYSFDPMVNPYDPTLGFQPPFDVPFDQNPARQADAALDQDGTHLTYRRVYLQRLANPLMPFDAETNPYRVVDWMPIDLTVYNGLHNPADPDDPSLGAGGPDEMFQSRERGLDPVGGGQRPRLLWNNRNETPGTSGEAAVEPLGGHHFKHVLTHTLGYLNSTYGDRFKKDFQAMPTTATDELAPGTPPEEKYVGAPNYNNYNSGAARGETFPWFTWNNRPFVSQYELMQVPRTRSSQLTETFSLRGSGTSAYDPSVPDDPDDPAFFGHLLNFFATSDPVPPDTTIPSADLKSDFCRLFDYTHVPSRFLGTEIWLDKNVFSTNAAGTRLRHPPFNRIPSFREPGKINLNTIFASSVFSALQGANSPGPGTGTFVSSRQGYFGGTLTALDATRPTRFSNPIRSSGESNMVPLTTQSLGQLDSTIFGVSKQNALNMERPPTEATLLRSNRHTAARVAPPSTNPPLFAKTSGATHEDPNRNPYFRYQSLQRLGNLATTRSNVYALWITVGFFEVDPVNGTLGQEVGVNSGDVKRHRGFYVIDRSIPVAFEPGENHNVDRAVRLRRFIE